MNKNVLFWIIVVMNVSWISFLMVNSVKYLNVAGNWTVVIILVIVQGLVMNPIYTSLKK